jgi:hypothetical protein
MMLRNILLGSKDNRSGLWMRVGVIALAFLARRYQSRVSSKASGMNGMSKAA